MKQYSIIQEITDTLLKSGGVPASDYIHEISLLVAFCNLHPMYQSDALPTAQQVIDGHLSLKEAYHLMAKASDFAPTVYKAAKLPVLISERKAIKYLTEIIAASNEKPNNWLKNLWGQFANDKFDCPVVLSQEQVKLITSLCHQGKPLVNTYTSFPMSIQLAAEMAKYSENVDFESAAISPITVATVLMTGIHTYKSDPLKAPSQIEAGQLRQYEHIVMSPPFGLRYKGLEQGPYRRFRTGLSGEAVAIIHGLSQSKGRIVTTAIQGFLFRGAGDRQLRQQLVDEGILEAVVQLSGSLMTATDISPCILVIDKKRNREAPVLFYNANHSHFTSVDKIRRGKKVLHKWQKIADEVNQRQDTQYSKRVSQAEIRDQDYDLSVSRYILSSASKAIKELHETRSLSEVADLIRAQLLKEDAITQGSDYLEVGVRDISSAGFITTPEKQLTLSGQARDRAEQQRLQPGDILLVIKGNVGKVGIVGNDCGENWVAGQLFQVIRLNHGTGIPDSAYLFRYLSSPLVQRYLVDQTSGSSMPVLKTSDIKQLPIPVPTQEEQQKVLDTHNHIQAAYQQIVQLKADINQLSNQHWPLASDDV